jgi:hypothetical protein
MTRVIESIFTSNCFYRQIDLQLAYDLKLLWYTLQINIKKIIQILIQN